MRTRRVDLIESEGPVDGPLSARNRWDSRAGVLLRIEDGDGRVGLGEASPLPFYSPDTLYDAVEALRAVNWEAIPEADTGEDAASWLTRASAALACPAADGREAPSARFALETALLDLLAQRREEPLHRLLSAESAAVPLCVLLGRTDEDAMLASARRAVDRGARTVKMKIVGPVLDDQMSILQRVREVIGDTALRLDANQTLVADTWERELERLTDVAPELVEEPAPLDALLGGRTSPLPLGLDESLQDPASWERLVPSLARLRCVAVVLKPTALGGFGACLKWAARAREHGLDVTVSHTFEGPVALAACAHLALAVASRTRASGIAPHGGLSPWPDVELPMLGPSSVTEGRIPGLGVSPSHFAAR